MNDTYAGRVQAAKVQGEQVQIAQIAGSLGAELTGLDLTTIGDKDFETIYQALFRYGVIFFRDQKLTREDQLALAKRFGKPEIHPIANGMDEYPEVIRVLKPAGEAAYFGTSWHTDNSFFKQPSAITILYGDQIPPFGGDTVFASMECT